MSDNIFTNNGSPSNTTYMPPDDTPPQLEEITPNEFESFKEQANKRENEKKPSADNLGEPNPDDYKDIKPSKVVRRADWGALKPNWIEALQTPINKVAVSFTETDPCYSEEECIKFIKKLQQEHLAEKNCADIKHNFLIGSDGVIYEGRGYTRVGPVYPPSPKKIEDLNGCSIDIALIERSSSEVPVKMVNALSFCVAAGANSGYITNETGYTNYYIQNNEIQEVQHRPPMSLTE